VESGIGPSVKSFVFSRDEKQFLVNSSDKLLRLYNISDYSLSHELVDSVNKVQWKSCHFAGDDYIVGGSADKQEHKIYIWSREFDQLYKILEGPNSEIILDIAWHPTRSIIVSCTSSGAVYVWSRQHTESWSAFAPGFTELEENEEYIEQEDEFDTIDEEELRKKNKEEDEDEYVDILTRADKDAEEEDFILPTHPIPDNYFVPQTVVVPPTKKQTKKRKVGVSSNNRTTKPKRRKKD